MEAWRPVKGYEDSYEVSDKGSVRSIDRIDSGGRRLDGRTLKPSNNGNGYIQVALSKNGKLKTHRIHHLVAQAFLLNPYAYSHVRHKNDIKSDNVVENLAWGTHLDNMADMNGFSATSGRVDRCARDHPFSSENAAPCIKSKNCLSCKRAGIIVAKRKQFNKVMPFDKEYASDIYYIALLNGHQFTGKGYTLETLEAEYGKQAKEWRQNEAGKDYRGTEEAGDLAMAGAV